MAAQNIGIANDKYPQFKKGFDIANYAVCLPHIMQIKIFAVINL